MKEGVAHKKLTEGKSCVALGDLSRRSHWRRGKQDKPKSNPKLSAAKSRPRVGTNPIPAFSIRNQRLPEKTNPKLEQRDSPDIHRDTKQTHLSCKSR
jgi:hypothetical protein